MFTLAETAFAELTSEELDTLIPYSACQVFENGETVFNAGDEDIAMFVVRSGALEVINPNDNNAVVVTHRAGQFSGDIDLLTRRPVMVKGVARGKTHVMRISNENVRDVLLRLPVVSDKLLVAFQMRREMLKATNVGLTVIGHPKCSETNELREFLYKNFVPFAWHDPTTEAGQQALLECDSPETLPAVRCNNGNVLLKPTLQELARGAGVWRHCPNRDVDLAIIGAGPAGVAAAVYAASEGLSTLVLDRLGPGGQAAGSSKIENFIGFPSGLTGADFATRGVLQMLKFGANLVAPVSVKSIDAAKASHDTHKLTLDCGAVISARSVIVATGVRWRKLEALGADRFERTGVYYACTTVEAVMHDQTDVAVVGAGNSAGQAAMYLSECCPSRKVHMIVRGSLGKSMSEYLVSRIRASKNIVVHEGASIKTVEGGRTIETIAMERKDGTQHTLGVTAVFVFIGAEPTAEFLPSTVARDSQGFLLTGSEVVSAGKWPLQDRDPCPLETSVPGILAAGDIRSGSTKRVGFAVGDGSLAVTCVHRLISL